MPAYYTATQDLELRQNINASIAGLLDFGVCQGFALVLVNVVEQFVHVVKIVFVHKSVLDESVDLEPEAQQLQTGTTHDKLPRTSRKTYSVYQA